MSNPESNMADVTDAEAALARALIERLREAASQTRTSVFMGAAWLHRFTGLLDEAIAVLTSDDAKDRRARDERLTLAAEALVNTEMNYAALQDRIAGLEAERDQYAAVLAQPWADKVEELAARAEAAEAQLRLSSGKTGWLIEMPSKSGPPTWWSLTNTEGEGGYFTSDSVKALRFARKQDAEAYIEDVCWTEAIATEHEWGDAPSTITRRT